MLQHLLDMRDTQQMLRRSTVGLVLAVAALLWPCSAFAKRRAPAPVPPVVWQGVEYRAPLDAPHVGHVLAYDVASGRKLWETTVYSVLINPLLEEDVQWVFISSLTIQGDALLVRNEDGKTFTLDLKTGLAKTPARSRAPWFLLGAVALVGALLAWTRARARRKRAL